MDRSLVFIVLAIALFFAGCLCAEETTAPATPATPAANSKEKAEGDVKALQDLTKQVLGTAESNSGDAEGVKSTVEDYKTKADNAELDAKKAAADIKENERKAEAAVVAQKAESELATCLQLYNAAKAKAQTASVSLNEFVKRAKVLVKNAEIQISPASEQSDDYTTVIQQAATFSSDTQKLSQEIDQSTALSEAVDALSQLSDSAKKVQVSKYQAESIAIASRIETALKTAEIDIQNIHEKKEEINTIVQAMKTKCKIPPDTSKSSLSSLCTTADSQLQTATTKLQESQQCNTDMQQRKTQLDTTLKTLKDTNLEDKATQEAGNVKGHKEFIDGELQKIKAALGDVKNALSSAKDVQQQMQEALDKTSAQPVNTHLDSTEPNKSTQLTDKQTQNPKDDKSELLNNDKLRNITKDITNNPLIGGEVPKRSAANDSAVTAFIPLLVVLVISAVLH